MAGTGRLGFLIRDHQLRELLQHTVEAIRDLSGRILFRCGFGLARLGRGLGDFGLLGVQGAEAF